GSREHRDAPLGAEHLACDLMRQFSASLLETLGRPGDMHRRGGERVKLREKLAQRSARYDHQHVTGALERRGEIGLDPERWGKRGTRQITLVAAARGHRR